MQDLILDITLLSCRFVARHGLKASPALQKLTLCFPSWISKAEASSGTVAEAETGSSSAPLHQSSRSEAAEEAAPRPTNGGTEGRTSRSAESSAQASSSSNGRLDLRKMTCTLSYTMNLQVMNREVSPGQNSAGLLSQAKQTIEEKFSETGRRCTASPY